MMIVRRILRRRKRERRSRQHLVISTRVRIVVIFIFRQSLTCVRMAGDRYKKRQQSRKRKAQKEAEDWSDTESGEPQVQAKKLKSSMKKKPVRGKLPPASQSSCVFHLPDETQFRLEVPGEQEAAVLLYSVISTGETDKETDHETDHETDQETLPHVVDFWETKVPLAARGGGLGGALAVAALDWAVQEGRKVSCPGPDSAPAPQVKLSCSFLRRWLREQGLPSHKAVVVN